MSSHWIRSNGLAKETGTVAESVCPSLGLSWLSAGYGAETVVGVACCAWEDVGGIESLIGDCNCGCC